MKTKTQKKQVKSRNMIGALVAGATAIAGFAVTASIALNEKKQIKSKEKY